MIPAGIDNMTPRKTSSGMAPVLTSNALTVAQILKRAGEPKSVTSTREASGLAYAAFQAATGELAGHGMLRMVGSELTLRGAGWSL